ncbi:MAG: aminotransferase class III-fold pyridoxal phosphate-dependent enzyme, partial [Bacteroidia bacterium]|nr:aminotransferase class III-fold pyridoxal phosphate-dependent enzyme [Bacteroidia bacterium]
LITNAANVGTYIIEAVKQMPNIKEVRGLGLMIGIELNEPCAPLRNKLLFDHHIFTGASSNKNTLRILPALNLNKQEADIFLTALASLLAS